MPVENQLSAGAAYVSGLTLIDTFKQKKETI